MRASFYKYRFFAFASLAGLAILSCQNQGGNGQAGEEPSEDIIKKEIILTPESQELLATFPTPYEAATMLQKARAPFVPRLENPPSNISKYFTEKTKALNLGVYSADLAYASVYQNIAEMEKLIDCTGRLAGDLGIGAVYDRNLVPRINKLKNNKDSLIGIVRQVILETNDFLRRNNRTQVTVLVATGGFVEMMYVISSLCQISTDNREIVSCLYQQEDKLNMLLRILGEYGDDSNIRPLTAELSKLKVIFSERQGKPLTMSPQRSREISAITGSVRAGIIK